jgi:hypothetical protein
MTQEQRDSWTNIILLCDGHHGKVDSQANVAEYPAVLLLQWKEEREEGRIGDLPELQGISDLDLQQLLLRQVEGVLGSIERLEGVSQAVIDELKGIVEHQFIDPKLDLDAMAEFSFAVRSLRGMAFSEDVTLLHRATDDLKRIGLEDQASLLISASRDLKHLNDLDAFALRQVRNDLDDSFSRFSAGLRELSQGTDSLKEANDQAALNLAAGPQHYWMDDIRRFWAFISRAFLVGAAVGGTAVAALAVWISNGG